MTKRSVLTFAVLFASFPEGTSAASLTLRSSRLRGSSQGHRHLADSQYSQTELEYFQNCENLFLSDSVVGDGLISQKDFASTFDTLCSRYSTGGSCKTFGFNSLASNLQTTFFEAVCSTMEDSMACASNLRSLNSMDFGYIVSSETMPQVQMRVETFCLELLEDVFAAYPTPSPTVSPTSDPTASPVDSTTTFTGPLPEDVPGTSDSSEPDDSLPDDSDVDDEESPSTTPEEDTIDQKSLDLTGVDESTGSQGYTGSQYSSTGWSVSEGPFLGIATAASACLLLVLAVAYRQRRRNGSDITLHLENKNIAPAMEDPEAPEVHKYKAKDNASDSSTISATSNDSAPFLPRSETRKTPSAPPKQFFRDHVPSPNAVAISQIGDAVDNANWDEIYRIASELAELEDISTLSSAGRRRASRASIEARLQRRSHLSAEDTERTRNLDELIDNHDWTGVAVTAALYAGESGYKSNRNNSSMNVFGMSSAARRETSPGSLQEHSWRSHQAPTDEAGSVYTHGSKSRVSTHSLKDHQLPSLSGKDDSSLVSLKDSIDQAVDAGDWDKVLSLSSEVENNDSFRSRKEDYPAKTLNTAPVSDQNDASLNTLQKEMDRAINQGDWSLVGFYADKIKECKGNGAAEEEENTSTSQALVPAAKPQGQFYLEDDSSLNKKRTIQKLARAQKWKGLSIMAGLYEMESKGSLSVDMDEPSSPSSPRS